MASRLTDTTIWKKQKWFKKLPLEYKLCWKYLTDECDYVGIWKVDFSELLEDLGVDEFDFEEFIKACNKDYDKKTGKGIHRERIMKIDEHLIWLTGFMSFQYGGKTGIISSKNNTVPNAIKYLTSLNLFQLGLNMRYFKVEGHKPLEAPLSPSKPLEAPVKELEGGKDKDKSKDQDQVINDVNLLMDNDVDEKKNQVDERLVIPSMQRVFVEKVKTYTPVVKLDFEALTVIAGFIVTKENLKGGIVNNQPKILSVWGDMAEWISGSDWFSKKSLKTISNSIQEISQKYKDGHTKPITSARNGQAVARQRLLDKGTAAFNASRAGGTDTN